MFYEKRNLTFLAVLFGALWFAGCTKDQEENKNPTKSGTGNLTSTIYPVKTVEVKMQPYTEYQDYFGKVGAIEEADLVIHTGGYVKSVKAVSGDVVKKGAKLCDIEGDKYKTQFDMAKLSEKVAQDNYKRLRSHLKSGRSSRLNVDKANLEFLQAKKSRIDAEIAYNEAHCVAPFDGVVTAVPITKFQNLTPGSGTISMANLDDVKIQFNIPEKTLGDIKRGSFAKVLVGFDNNSKWQDTELYAVDQKIDYKQKNFRAEIRLKNSKGLMKPGMTVKVRARNYDLQNQVVIPSVAVITLENSRAVMLANGNNAKRVDVKIISNNGKHALVGSGIKEGDQLIIEGQNQVVDGAPINLVNSPEKKDKKS